MNMASLIEIKPNPNIPTLAAGDTVKVSIKIAEGEKERIQHFQGVVIRVRRSGAGSSFTVRRVAYGVGVERTFPMHSPLVEKVELMQHGKVRQAKLYYLRGLSAKAARIKERRLSPQELEREREEAQRLKQEQELAMEQAKAAKLEIEPEAQPETEETPEAVLEQEPEMEEASKLEVGQETEQEQEEAPELEVDTEEPSKQTPEQEPD
jgi:large subunit ribosomal protein L19